MPCVRGAAASVAGAVALLWAGCGAEDFENEPRAAASVELSALVTDDQVEMGPDQVGAGLVEITISNQSDDDVRLTLEGPTDEASREISAGSTGRLMAKLDEGSYEVSGGDASGARSTRLTVGPERKTSQNELLLP